MTQAVFETFYEASSQPLWRYLLRICSDAALAEDILQESYLRFLQKPPTERAEAAMMTYLYRIATRLHLDHTRREQRARAGVLAWLTEFVRPAPDPVQRAENRLDMEAAFSALQPRDRSLLWLAYVEDQPHSVIGEILGLGEKSVKVMLFRARRRLAGVLQTRESEMETQA